MQTIQLTYQSDRCAMDDTAHWLCLALLATREGMYIAAGRYQVFAEQAACRIAEDAASARALMLCYGTLAAMYAVEPGKAGV